MDCLDWEFWGVKMKTLVLVLLLASCAQAQVIPGLGAGGDVLTGMIGGKLFGGMKQSRIKISGTAADLFANSMGGGQGGGHIVIAYPPMMGGQPMQPQQPQLQPIFVSPQQYQAYVMWQWQMSQQQTGW